VLSSFGPSSFPNLRGAIADAEHFYEYLTSTLEVPKERITVLHNEQATRSKIIAAFRKLGNDKDICHGDSIIIFYAGHGAQALPPQRLLGKPGCPKYTELLVPYDFNKFPGQQDSMGIPDYTLAALLNTIARNKGDRIVSDTILL
jgi:hypothetical protein